MNNCVGRGASDGWACMVGTTSFCSGRGKAFPRGSFLRMHPAPFYREDPNPSYRPGGPHGYAVEPPGHHQNQSQKPNQVCNFIGLL